MAFTHMQEHSQSFNDMGKLRDYICATEKHVTQIPVLELIEDKACFFGDSRFGTQNHSYAFTEYSFKALCNLFSIPHPVISGIAQAGLASILLNDYMKSKGDRQDLDNAYFVVDDQQKCILGIVTSTYVYYSNMDFLDAIDNYLFSSEAQSENTKLESAYYNNTRMYVRLITDIEAGVVTGRGGDGLDKTKVGLQLTNSMVGDLPVRVAFYLLRLICSNGLVSKVSEAVAVVKHSGHREGFEMRLRERITSLLRQSQLANEMLTKLVGINFDPTQLVSAGYADMILNIIPEMRSTIRSSVSLAGEANIRDAKERKNWRETQYISEIPSIYGREHSLAVFNSSFRNHATLFDFVNVLTEYAKELPIMTKLMVEERVGDFAELIVNDKKICSSQNY